MKLMMMMMMTMVMTMMMMKGETLATDSPRWPTARLFPAGAIQLSRAQLGRDRRHHRRSSPEKIVQGREGRSHR